MKEFSSKGCLYTRPRHTSDLRKNLCHLGKRITQHNIADEAVGSNYVHARRRKDISWIFQLNYIGLLGSSPYTIGSFQSQQQSNEDNKSLQKSKYKLGTKKDASFDVWMPSAKISCVQPQFGVIVFYKVYSHSL